MQENRKTIKHKAQNKGKYIWMNLVSLKKFDWHVCLADCLIVVESVLFVCCVEFFQAGAI